MEPASGWNAVEYMPPDAQPERLRSAVSNTLVAGTPENTTQPILPPQLI